MIINFDTLVCLYDINTIFLVFMLADYSSSIIVILFKHITLCHYVLELSLLNKM